jgi:hypothetical protein
MRPEHELWGQSASCHALVKRDVPAKSKSHFVGFIHSRGSFGARGWGRPLPIGGGVARIPKIQY